MSVADDGHNDLDKTVHKTAPIDLVGWFTIAPTSGPQIQHLRIHRQVLTIFDSAILLTFHPDLIHDQLSGGGNLPLTIWESVREAAWADELRANRDNTDGMVLDDGAVQTEIRFRKLAYTVETGEAEMVGVDYVAKGPANATAVTTTSSDGLGIHSQRNAKGKRPETLLIKERSKSTEEDEALSSEERECTPCTTKVAMIRVVVCPRTDDGR